jgi:hypothetical protein
MTAVTGFCELSTAGSVLRGTFLHLWQQHELPTVTFSNNKLRRNEPLRSLVILDFNNCTYVRSIIALVLVELRLQRSRNLYRSVNKCTQIMSKELPAEYFWRFSDMT